MEAWIIEHWYWIALALGLLIKTLNLITKHWAEHKGLVKVCLFLVDLLDVIKVTPDPNGKPKKKGPILPLLVVLLFVTSCTGAGIHKALVAGYHGINAADNVAIPAMHTACMAEKAACIKKGITVKAKCTRLVKCQEVRNTIVMGLKTSRTAVGELDAAIKLAVAMGWIKKE